MLGRLCQHQSNLGSINNVGNSKEPVFILSLGGICWVLSTCLLGCLQGTCWPCPLGNKPTGCEVTASLNSEDTPDSAVSTSWKLVIWAGLITHNVNYMPSTGHLSNGSLWPPGNCYLCTARRQYDHFDEL